MWFYLACAIVFALMLFGLRSCGAEYVSVAQASLHHGKGGEAQGRQLKRHHKYYGYAVHDRLHLRWLALSAAVPAPHIEPKRDTAGTTERKTGDRFDTVTPEPGRTPQQIIDETFTYIGWK